MKYVAAAALACIIALPSPAAAVDGRPRAQLPVVATAPSLDGDAGWTDAARTDTVWDFTHARPALEPAEVQIAADATDLFVRFTVRQNESITQTQAVDSAGENADDTVTVRLWPSGTSGFAYDFRANPRGTHYQASSENANYAPAWVSHGRAIAGGYVVTMRIPFNAIRSDGRTQWLAQFERDIKTTGERDVWAHGPGQSSSDQVVFAGLVDGVVTRAARTKPRVGVYALAQAGPPEYGGNTSRLGADIALPLTQTASFVATIHPDFSNVEVDQQTIAPTTFTRYYNEVRPFFAQGAKFYDATSCYGCPGWSDLYTPAIPTPRSGYQLEGTQGPFTFGALDAIGDGRDDNAQSLAWTSRADNLTVNYTRVASEQTDLTDLVNFGSVQYNSQHGIIGYVEAAAEQGSTITAPAQARRYDGGIAYQTKDDFDSFSIRHVGAQWNPVDGYTSVNDIAGYSAQLGHTFQFASGALKSIALFGYRDYYHGSDGFGNNLQDFQQSSTFTFAHQLDAVIFTGSEFYRVPYDPMLHPDNQQGFKFDYKANTPEQSTFNYNFGAFGTGWLFSIDRLAAFRVMNRATVALEAYDTKWIGPAVNQQWLERATATFDIDHQTSAVISLRRIVGTAPPFPGQALPLPANTTNWSVSYGRRRPHDDIFLVYGDPNAPYTQNTFILKYVHYFGADRGT